VKHDTTLTRRYSAQLSQLSCRVLLTHPAGPSIVAGGLAAPPLHANTQISATINAILNLIIGSFNTLTCQLIDFIALSLNS
jgi:hypothetical protein